MKQVRELHDILTELHDEEMVLSGIFHVVVIVKKLPFYGESSRLILSISEIKCL